MERKTQGNRSAAKRHDGWARQSSNRIFRSLAHLGGGGRDADGDPSCLYLKKRLIGRFDRPLPNHFVRILVFPDSEGNLRHPRRRHCNSRNRESSYCGAPSSQNKRIPNARDELRVRARQILKKMAKFVRFAAIEGSGLLPVIQNNNNLLR